MSKIFDSIIVSQEVKDTVDGMFTNNIKSGDNDDGFDIMDFD
jgi:hypothetical protein